MFYFISEEAYAIKVFFWSRPTAFTREWREVKGLLIALDRRPRLHIQSTFHNQDNLGNVFRVLVEKGSDELEVGCGIGGGSIEGSSRPAVGTRVDSCPVNYISILPFSLFLCRTETYFMAAKASSWKECPELVRKPGVVKPKRP